MNQIFFWANEDKFGVFSNFYPCNVKIDGKVWPTTEHYFAAMKTNNPGDQEMIRKAKTPYKAKQLGRRNIELRPDWESVKFDIMLKALRHKFEMPEFKEILLSSGTADIYEDSPYDKVWGTGIRGEVGSGKNLLGKALMIVREELKA